MSFSSYEFNGEGEFDSDFTTPSGHQGVTFLAADRDLRIAERLSGLFAQT